MNKIQIKLWKSNLIFLLKITFFMKNCFVEMWKHAAEFNQLLLQRCRQGLLGNGILLTDCCRTKKKQSNTPHTMSTTEKLEKKPIKQTEPPTSASFQSTYAGENTVFFEPTIAEEQNQNLLPDNMSFGNKEKKPVDIIWDQKHWKQSLQELTTNPERRRQFIELIILIVVSVLVCGCILLCCLSIVGVFVGGGAISLIMKVHATLFFVNIQES